MARVETGHIHLGSSILRRAEAWETKTGRNTQTHKDSYERTYACTGTKEGELSNADACDQCSLQDEHLREGKYRLCVDIPHPTKFL